MKLLKLLIDQALFGFMAGFIIIFSYKEIGLSPGFIFIIIFFVLLLAIRSFIHKV
jgi:hypothetical protein